MDCFIRDRDRYYIETFSALTPQPLFSVSGGDDGGGQTGGDRGGHLPGPGVSLLHLPRKTHLQSGQVPAYSKLSSTAII